VPSASLPKKLSWPEDDVCGIADVASTLCVDRRCWVQHSGTSGRCSAAASLVLHVKVGKSHHIWKACAAVDQHWRCCVLPCASLLLLDLFPWNAMPLVSTTTATCCLLMLPHSWIVFILFICGHKSLSTAWQCMLSPQIDILLLFQLHVMQQSIGSAGWIFPPKMSNPQNANASCATTINLSILTPLLLFLFGA